MDHPGDLGLFFLERGETRSVLSLSFIKMRSMLIFLARVSKIPVKAANPGSFAKVHAFKLLVPRMQK